MPSPRSPPDNARPTTRTAADGIQSDATLDAAIAKVRTGIHCNPVTKEGRRITGSAAAGQDQKVFKRGRATKARVGVVIDPNSADVVKPGGVAATQQMLVRTHNEDPAIRLNSPFQVQGDSVSVILDAAGCVVGLMHGQDPNDARIGQATHIGPILNRFNCRILTVARAAP